MPVRRKTKQVPSSLSYMIVIQNSQIMPDCFRLAKFPIHNGTISVWKISSEGKVIDLSEGTIINGKFHKAED
jgi:hypothetical protein